jgi:hypothetical protein
MNEVLVPFTMVPLRTAIPRPSMYVTIQTRSAHEHVLSIVPRYLQGTSGVIDLITTFLGSTHKWVRVVGDSEVLYRNRHQDLYFLFWVCSHRLPLPDSFEKLRSHWYRRGTVRRLICIDKGSQMIPIGQGGLWYSRTGHMGTREELAHLVRTVSCRGYVTRDEPVLPIVGVHVIVTDRPDYWSGRVSANTLLVHIVDLQTLDPNTPWDSVVLDRISTPIPTCCSVYPDSRHLSGSISADWIRLDTTFPLRKTTIVYTESIASSVEMIEYMFILRTRYRGELFINRVFNRELYSVIRLAETMLLECIII